MDDLLRKTLEFNSEYVFKKILERKTTIAFSFLLNRRFLAGSIVIVNHDYVINCPGSRQHHDYVINCLGSRQHLSHKNKERQKIVIKRIKHS